MTDKVTLTDLANLQNDTSVVSVINANNSAITTALNNTLSRDPVSGSANAMAAQLDMNGFNIINLPSPATVDSPARLQDVVDITSLVIPATGTSGATVPLLNGDNTYSGTSTFTGAVDMSGAVTAPTPLTSDSSTKVATTAYVQANLTAAADITGLSVLGNAGTTSAAPAAITGTADQFLGVNHAGTALAFETMSGDATLSSGAITLATVNTNTGSFGGASSVPTVTVNGKGLITAASANAVVAPAGTLSGTTLNSTVVTSSLTKVANDIQLAADAAAPATSSVVAQSVVAGTTNTAGTDLTIKGSKGTGTGVGGSVVIATAPAGSSGTSQNAVTNRLIVDAPGNVAVGTGVLATTATAGFLYIPTCAGTPTGIPTTKSGLAPMVLDSTNSKFYMYVGGAWKGVTIA